MSQPHTQLSTVIGAEIYLRMMAGSLLSTGRHVLGDVKPFPLLMIFVSMSLLLPSSSAQHLTATVSEVVHAACPAYYSENPRYFLNPLLDPRKENACGRCIGERDPACKHGDDCHCHMYSAVLNSDGGCAAECGPLLLCNPPQRDSESSHLVWRKEQCLQCVHSHRAECAASGLDWEFACLEKCYEVSACLDQCQLPGQVDPRDSICASCVSRHSSACAEEAKRSEVYSLECQKVALNEECGGPLYCQRWCGDGVKSADEECDDGNNNAGDGCGIDCRLENQGHTCWQDDRGKTACTFCGDGVRTSDEECDDGNQNSFDGCSSSCKVEEGFSCQDTDRGDGTVGSQCHALEPQCGPRVRRDWNRLSEAEKETFLEALDESFRRGYFTKFGAMHSAQPNERYAHNTNAFLPWHRVFLYQFETMLRSLGPKFRCVTLPYWDWAEDQAVCLVNGGCSNLQESSGEVLDRFGGSGNGQYRSVSVVSYNVRGQCVTGDRASQWVNNMCFGSWCTRPDHDESCPFLRNNFYSQGSIGTGSSASIANTLINTYGYSNLRTTLQGQMHNNPHIQIGGNMVTFTSPIDPIFFLHHTMIDKLWDSAWKCRGFSVTVADYCQQGDHYQGTGASVSGYSDAPTGTMPYVVPTTCNSNNVDLCQTRPASEDLASFWDQRYAQPRPCDALDVAQLGYEYERDDIDYIIADTHGGQCHSATVGTLLASTRPSRFVQMVMAGAHPQVLLEEHGSQILADGRPGESSPGDHEAYLQDSEMRRRFSVGKFAYWYRNAFDRVCEHINGTSHGYSIAAQGMREMTKEELASLAMEQLQTEEYLMMCQSPRGCEDYPAEWKRIMNLPDNIDGYPVAPCANVCARKKDGTLKSRRPFKTHQTWSQDCPEPYSEGAY